MASGTELERIASLETAVPHLATKAGLEGVRVKIQVIRADLQSVRTDMENLKADVKVLKAEVKSIRFELKVLRWLIGATTSIGVAASFHIIHLLNQAIALKSLPSVIPPLHII
ncbi:MAG: hypothetical protein OXG39_13695 [Chloroflexi bacterium]|nr:hypothetical protein [Chloroflexota bacterium]